jgi:predicted dinucleotide-binding enzyme
MKIGILGTGTVGQTFAAKLLEHGHEVMIGTRNVAATLARSEPDAYGNPPFKTWLEANSRIHLGNFAEAGAHGDLLINATSGTASLEVLRQAGAQNLDGKILMDISNPLDFSKGMPPSLSVCNTDSLGEQLQRAFPGLKVVKTLNTLTAHLMVNPRELADGDHTAFVSGNDAAAKGRVCDFLSGEFGWKHIIDLGDITTARGTEMLLPIWLRLWGALRTPLFNMKVVR